MADFPQVCARVSDAAVTRFTGGALPAEQVRPMFQELIKTQNGKAPYGNRAIVLKTNQLNIGYCGLSDLPHTAEKLIELSYGLNREYWGNGYATEAAAALLSHALNELGLPEVVSAIHPRNTASIRVAEKLGLSFRKKMEWPGQGQVNLYAIRRPV